MLTWIIDGIAELIVAYREERMLMNISRHAWLTVAIFAALFIAGIVWITEAAFPANAAPQCAAYDTCQYMPNPSYDGPLLPVWDTPGTYGGWTTLPIQCVPGGSCSQIAPGN